MSDKPISPLRQRMIDDMTARRVKEGNGILRAETGGRFRRRTRENGRNSVRRPRHAALSDRNCEGFCVPGNRVGLPTDGHRDLTPSGRGIREKYQRRSFWSPKRSIRRAAFHFSSRGPASRSSVALWPSRPLATSSTLGLSVSARTGDHDPQASSLCRTMPRFDAKFRKARRRIRLWPPGLGSILRQSPNGEVGPRRRTRARGLAGLNRVERDRGGAHRRLPQTYAPHAQCLLGSPKDKDPGSQPFGASPVP